MSTGNRLGFIFTTMATSVLLSACSQSNKSVVVREEPRAEFRNIPGVVEYAWEEPMVDVIDVPPGLDPEGHYYRPGHQEVVEIRQGRWKYMRRPGR